MKLILPVNVQKFEIMDNQYSFFVIKNKKGLVTLCISDILKVA